MYQLNTEIFSASNIPSTDAVSNKEFHLNYYFLNIYIFEIIFIHKRVSLYFLSLFDRLLLSTSVESNECNMQQQKNVFLFHRLLCHLTREAVGPVIERKKKEKETIRRTTINTHTHRRPIIPLHTYIHSFLSLTSSFANSENLVLVGPFTTNVSCNKVRVGCLIATS
jgi:hypothetical protein